MTKRHLELQLQKLQEGADAQYDAYRRSHEQLWGLLAKSYLWWREASEESGYLEALYKKRKIGLRTGDSNVPNFNPLIRLIWNIQEVGAVERVTMSQWNKALQSVHEHYAQHAEDFRHNAEGKLTAYIEEQGGVVGLTTSGAGYAEDEKQADRPRRKSHSSTLTTKGREEIARRALTELKAQKQGVGSVAVRETVRVGGDGLLVLLARREKNGRITVLGSSNDPSQIDAVAALAVQTNLTNLPPNLRSFVEIIATQAFPSHALPMSPEQRSKWFRTSRYPDKSDLWQGDLEDWTGEGRGERLRSTKRLLLRGKERDVLLNGSWVSVSPVTRCVLNEPLIDKGDTVFLRVLERATIEQWIETKEITLLRAEPKHRLKHAERSEIASYKLAVTNSVSGYTKFLHFYDHVPDNKITHYQADFQRDKFKADWSVRLNKEWFADLRQSWADEWFAGLGRFNQILRPHNEVLELKVTADKLYIIFNLHPSNSPFRTIPFPEPIKTLKRTQKTAYFSKDLAPILFNLADAHSNGAVTMASNAHAAVFRYSTKVGRFEIAVPSLDAKHKHRDGTLFYALDKRQ